MSTNTVKIGAREYLRETLARMTEKQLQREVRQMLCSRKIPHTVSDASIAYDGQGSQVIRVDPDWPDLTLVCPGSGQALMVELKRPVGGEGLSYGQAVKLSALWEAGALILVARSVEEVEGILETRKVSQATIDEVKARIAKGPTKKEILRLTRKGRRGKSPRSSVSPPNATHS